MVFSVTLQIFVKNVICFDMCNVVDRVVLAVLGQMQVLEISLVPGVYSTLAGFFTMNV